MNVAETGYGRSVAEQVLRMRAVMPSGSITEPEWRAARNCHTLVEKHAASHEQSEHLGTQDLETNRVEAFGPHK